jgi:hypothetical protein
VLQPRERAAVVRAHDAAVLRVKTVTTDALVEAWNNLPDHRDVNVERFAAQAAARVQAATKRTANLTDAFVTRVLADGVASPGIVDTSAMRPGVTAQEEYMRPAKTLWTSLGNGSAYGVAVAEGATRLAGLIATDIQLAKTRQFAASTEGRKSASGGFRRYVTGRENCALCLIASTQRYRRGDLMPIHPGCDCGVEPLRDGENVGQVIDPARLEATQNWIESAVGGSDRSARDLGFGKTVEYNTTGSDAAGNTRFSRNVRSADYTDLIAVQEHGEYGPTLSWRQHSFTSADDL